MRTVSENGTGTKRVCPCVDRPSILVVDDNIFNVVTLQTMLEFTFNQ